MTNFEKIYSSTCGRIDYEDNVQKLYEVVLGSGCVAIDIGAHRGRHLLPMLDKVGPKGKVVGFEPIPDHYEQLLETIKNNGYAKDSIDLYNLALSNYSGTSRFNYVTNASGFSGLKQRVYDQDDVCIEEIEVKVDKLDHIVSKLNRKIDYIKLDIEGGEWDAIQGSEGIIDHDRPVITFEFGKKSYAGYDTNVGDVADFFFSKKYLLLDIIGNIMRDPDEFILSDNTPGLWDYAAVPNEYEKLSELKEVLAPNGTGISLHRVLNNKFFRKLFKDTRSA